jgi:hypothetical protein
MISYSNTIKENVLDSLDKIVNDEFTDIPIHYDLDVIARRVSSDVREYTVLIRLFRKSAGDHRKHTELDPITKTIERLKRLIANNSDYSPSSTYKWHDGRITNIEYQVDNEELPEYKMIDVTFACVVEEVLS